MRQKWCWFLNLSREYRECLWICVCGYVLVGMCLLVRIFVCVYERVCRDSVQIVDVVVLLDHSHSRFYSQLRICIFGGRGESSTSEE